MTWPWDGSELPVMPVMERVGTIDKGVAQKSMWIGLNDAGEKVIFKPTNMTPATQAMMDELKPAFGLPKMGTMRVAREKVILLRWHDNVGTLSEISKISRAELSLYAKMMQPILRFAIVCNSSDPTIGNVLVTPLLSPATMGELIPIDEMFGLTDKPEKDRLLSRPFIAQIKATSHRDDLKNAMSAIDREQIRAVLERFNRASEFDWVVDRIDRLPELWERLVGFAI